MDISEISWEFFSSIHLDRGRDQLRFHKRRGISWQAEWLLASQEGLHSMVLDTDLREIGREDLGWIRQARNRVQWWILWNTLIKLRVP